MGYYFLITPCINCGKMFSCNPDRVPSVRVNGVREPVCLDCFKLRQQYRKEQGLLEETYLPGAYDPAPDGITDGYEDYD